MRRTASAASTAPPPLFNSFDARAGPSLLLVLDREDAVGERNAARDRQVHQGPGALAGDDVVMARLAADHAAERDHGVVGLAGLLGRVESDGDGAPGFRARRRRSARPRWPAPPRRAAARRAEARRRFLVEARLDDEDAGAGNRRTGSRLSACVAKP